MATTTNTNINWATPNNVISQNPLHVLKPSLYDSENSGGTLGLLDYYRNSQPSEHLLSQAKENSHKPHLHNFTQQPSFDSTTMMLWIDGGKKKASRRKFIQGPTRSGDFLYKYRLNRQDSIVQHMALFHTIHDKFITKMVPDRQDTAWMTQIAAFTGSLTNHFGLGVSTILNAGNDDQRGLWLPLAIQTKMIISYAQTELKHGSNVRGLHCIAEYNHEHASFIINTPTLGSIKWWPGCLGATATHALVYAHLLLNGNEYGVHSFLVQVRDQNHGPLFGIEIGDNGDCIGDYGNDTGFLRLTNVVIPVFNMLARFQWIDENGTYVKSEEKRANPQLHYLTMMATRGGMISKQSGILSRAVVIASRYSFLRTQGFIQPDLLTGVNTILSFQSDTKHLPQQSQMHPLQSLQQGLLHNTSIIRLPHTVIPHLHRDQPISTLHSSPNISTSFMSMQQPEYPIIEYTSHRNRILKQLSFTYILKSTSTYMINMLAQLNNGDDSAAGGGGLDLSFLHDIAPITAGLKATTTSFTHQGLLDLNQSLGGNGYLKSTGIGELWASYCWETTAEGERIPMLLQCARSLLKTMLDANIPSLLDTNRSQNHNHSDTTINTSQLSTPMAIDIPIVPTSLDYTPSSLYISSLSQHLANATPSITHRGSTFLPMPSTESTEHHPLVFVPPDCNLYNICFHSLQSQFGTTSTNTSTLSALSQFSSLNNPLIIAYTNQSPVFLLYLLRLSQYRSMCIWAEVFILYHQQLLYLAKATQQLYEPWNSTIHQSTSLKHVELNGESGSSVITTIPLTSNTAAISTSPFPLTLSNESRFEMVFNSIGSLLVLAAEAHCKFYMFSAFIHHILEIYTTSYPSTHTHHIMAQCIIQNKLDLIWQYAKETTIQNPPSIGNNEDTPQYQTLLPVLTNLATFYITNEYLQENSLASNPFRTFSQVLTSHSFLFHLQSIASNSLINDIIPLGDSFDLADSVLCTTIGNYDGNPYESLFHEALLAENNQQSPFHPAGYEKWMKARFDTDFLTEGKNDQFILHQKIFASLPTDHQAKL